MPIQILMPALSPTMTEGNLAKWHKKVGDTVKAGEVIAEIETDKATMEVEAVDEGRIGKILIEQGAQAVKVNTPIAILLEEGENDADIKATTPSPQPSPARGEGAVLAVDNTSATSPLAGEGLKTLASASKPLVFKGEGERIIASPLAKRIAEQNGVDLRAVAGSGPNGRIVRTDVESFAPSSGGTVVAMPQSSVNAASMANALGQKYMAVPNSQIRKIIAKRLTESKQTVPHFYLTVDCRIDRLLAMRAEINSQEGMKVSVNDLIIKAVGKALAKVPAANTSWSDDAILQYENVDVSVAVATPNGLVTPILTNADKRSISDISTTMKDLATRAKGNKLKPQEFQGGGFTISNLGMYGISHFAAIINPPQSCILAVGAGEKKPIVVDDVIEVGTVMSVTLSVDHRSVDGAVGAEFLQAFKGFIENPLSMVV